MSNRERHTWTQYDYLDLEWPKQYCYTMLSEGVPNSTFEISSLKEYMKRQRTRHPDRVFIVIKDQWGHEIKWRRADE